MYVLSLLYFFICMSPRVCVGRGGQAPLHYRRRRLWYAYKWDGRAGARGYFFFVLLPLYLSIYMSPGLCRGKGVQAPLYSHRWRLWYTYKRDGRAGVQGPRFLCFRLCIFPFAFFPEFVGTGGASVSLLSVAALVVCIQAGREGGRARRGLHTFTLVFSY